MRHATTTSPSAMQPNPGYLSHPTDRTSPPSYAFYKNYIRRRLPRAQGDAVKIGVDDADGNGEEKREGKGKRRLTLTANGNKTQNYDNHVAFEASWAAVSCAHTLQHTNRKNPGALLIILLTYSCILSCSPHPTVCGVLVITVDVDYS